jgi:hypothetical protein
MAGEYGPSGTDIRHRVYFGGSFDMKWGFRISPLFTATSGAPYNVTIGHDLFGDTLFNARPGIATDPNKPGVVATSYGLLDPNPTPGEPVLPRNFGRGPGIYMLNVNLRKTFAFGPPRETASSTGGSPSKGAPERRYSFSLSMAVRNILNHDNPGPIVGNIASPRFGQANQPYGGGTLGGTGFSESADNRRLELQARFSF